MILKNAVIFDENFAKKQADIKIQDGKIIQLGSFPEEDGIDCSGCIITPSFIDIHIHGCNGGDFCGGIDSMKKMSEHLIKNGITSFCGTTMTLPQEDLAVIMENAKAFRGTEPGARLIGINMEGPFISGSKKGAQNEKYIRAGSIAEFRDLNKKSGNMIKLVDIAPESFDSDAFIREVSKDTVVSVGHSNADAAQAENAFSLGAGHVTHLFNAMSPMTHRAPGVAGAALANESVLCELICDGNHIDPTVVRIAFKILGEDRAVVISDSMKASGMPDGVYDLGGQDVYVSGGFARLKDGTIAASISNIYEEFKNLLSFGIDEKTALKCCTINPAKAIREEKKIGSIAPGKLADLIVFTPDYEIRAVLLEGELRHGTLA